MNGETNDDSIPTTAGAQGTGPSHTGVTTDERARVLHLLDFLAAYYARRNPPVHDITAYDLYLLRESGLATVPAIHFTPTDDSWLKVDFVELPPRPKIPDELADAFEAGTTPGPRIAPQILPDADARLASSARRWIEQVWTPWTAKHRDATAAKTLYRDLFETRNRLDTDRESVELVWGFGRLCWEPDRDTIIDHPLMTIPVEIDVDHATHQLTVRPAGALEIDSLYLAGTRLADQASFNAARRTIAELDDPIDPWDIETTDPLLQRLVRSIDQNGTVATEGEQGAATAQREWVLFLRRRLPDYQGFLDRMRDLYLSGAEIPDPIQALVIDEPSRLGRQTDPFGAGELESDDVVRPHEPLLLPLPTNEEQQRILQLAQRRSGVTVQGPPGTGKSHTIANIVSHYVAYGKRVLVVAEKEQALRVLADKIPPGIRGLSVSVLGADEEGRRRLESSINQIQTKVTGLDRDYADREIVRLTTELDAIDRKIAVTTGELLGTRRAETGTLQGRWPCGDTPTPSIAAIWVADHAAALGFIPDKLTPATSCPLTPSEFVELVGLTATITVAQAEAAQRRLPPADALPTGKDLAARFAELDTLNQRLATVATDITTVAALDEHGAEVDNLRRAVRAANEWLVKIAGSWLDRLRDRTTDPLIAGEWQDFVATTRSEREQIYTIRRNLSAHTVRTPERPGPQFETALLDAKQRLTAKGKLGMFAGDARNALDACNVDGRTPATPEDIDLCLYALRVSVLRRQLLTRWNTQVGRVEGPSVSDTAAEDEIGTFLDEITTILDWPARWSLLSGSLRQVLAVVPTNPGHNELAKATEILDVITLRSRQREVGDHLAALAHELSVGSNSPGSSPVWSELNAAITARHTETWDQARANVVELSRIAPHGLHLLELRDRLAGAAPQWMAAIVASTAAAGDPSVLAEAWQWRQLRTWVASVATSGDPAGLQHSLEQLSEDRRRVVTDLVAERAWRRLADNLKDRHRQALNSYVKAVSRYGKTGGKFAARWLAEIRNALNESKDAIPVWIMPTARALASFQPDAMPPFDVLIIDEASQIGIESLPLFSLARSTIVVGDDKQTSPEIVGQDQQAIFNLMDEHLRTIPKYKTLLNPTNSLYDMAFQKFPDVVMLTEHFRCLPEIIQFSNIHAYDGRIIPLRDQPPQPGWVPLGAVKVLDGYRSGAVNVPEADAVVDLIAEMCDDTDYDDMDFGVVSLLGSTQSKLIWEKLFDRLGPDMISERRMRCGEPANFQGDERDVMILSTVVAVDPAHPEGRVGAMTGEAAARRINVAASRACNQMWIVHSVDPDRFPKGDLRAELIRHCQNPTRITTDLANLEQRCESEFERLVIRRIIARGYAQVKVQHIVGRYRIDIVIEGPDSRLAVEVDGDRWHGEDVWHQDRARQQVLERAGWTFERIRGSAFFSDPARALEPLWERLDALGIPTGADWVTGMSKSTVREVVGLRTPTPAIEADLDLEAELVVPSLSPALTVLAAAPVERLIDPRPVGSMWAPPQPEATHPSPVVDNRPALQRDSAPPRRLSPHPTDYVARQTSALRAEMLLPYEGWVAHPLPEVAFATQQQLIEGLVEIIAAEGPMHALYAYQLYLKAAGGHRVGKETRRTFNQATHVAVRSGLLAQLNDTLVGQIDKTLYVPGASSVVVRELGSRLLVEVPRSELMLLAGSLLRVQPDPSTLKRAVLDILGLTRLTARVSAYLDECFEYTWTE